MDKEKIYKMIALAMSGVAVLFGVLFLVFSVGLSSLNKNVRSLEAMLTDAVKENAQLKTEIKAFEDKPGDDTRAMGMEESQTAGTGRRRTQKIKRGKKIRRQMQTSWRKRKVSAPVRKKKVWRI